MPKYCTNVPDLLTSVDITLHFHYFTSTTKMRARETLIHILHTVFDLTDLDPLMCAMKLGKYDILTFVTTPDTIIDELEKANANIPSWQFAYITMFSKYFYYRQENGEPLQNNWPSLTKHDFNQWIQIFFHPSRDAIPLHHNVLQKHFKQNITIMW